MTEDVHLIKQDNVSGIDQVIALVNGHELRVERKGRRKTTQYRINTLVLADKPIWRLRFPWAWLFIMLIVIALLLPGSLVSYAPDKLYTGLGYAAGALIISLALYRMWKRTMLVRSFRTMHAHLPLAELARNKPSKEEFTDFVNHLGDSIRRYQEKHALPEDKQLAGEIRTLRRLKNEKIISKSEYENAKEKLFKLF